MVRKLNPGDKLDVQSMYNSGFTVREIASESKFSKTTIYKVLNEFSNKYSLKGEGEDYVNWHAQNGLNRPKHSIGGKYIPVTSPKSLEKITEDVSGKNISVPRRKAAFTWRKTLAYLAVGTSLTAFWLGVKPYDTNKTETPNYAQRQQQVLPTETQLETQKTIVTERNEKGYDAKKELDKIVGAVDEQVSKARAEQFSQNTDSLRASTEAVSKKVGYVLEGVKTYLEGFIGQSAIRQSRLESKVKDVEPMQEIKVSEVKPETKVAKAETKPLEMPIVDKKYVSPAENNESKSARVEDLIFLEMNYNATIMPDRMNEPTEDTLVRRLDSDRYNGFFGDLRKYVDSAMRKRDPTVTGSFDKAGKHFANALDGKAPNEEEYSKNNNKGLIPPIKGFFGDIIDLFGNVVKVIKDDDVPLHLKPIAWGREEINSIGRGLGEIGNLATHNEFDDHANRFFNRGVPNTLEGISASTQGVINIPQGIGSRITKEKSLGRKIVDTIFGIPTVSLRYVTNVFKEGMKDSRTTKESIEDRGLVGTTLEDYGAAALFGYGINEATSSHSNDGNGGVEGGEDGGPGGVIDGEAGGIGGTTP